MALRDDHRLSDVYDYVKSKPTTFETARLHKHNGVDFIALYPKEPVFLDDIVQTITDEFDVIFVEETSSEEKLEFIPEDSDKSKITRD